VWFTTGNESVLVGDGGRGDVIGKILYLMICKVCVLRRGGSDVLRLMKVVVMVHFALIIGFNIINTCNL
jgi:hypothetical protein